MDLLASQTGSYLLQGAALGITAAATPGPFQAFLINQMLVGGWRRSLPLAFAPLISDPPIVLAVVLLLNQIPDNFEQLISLVGGAFVLFLAWGLWRDWKKTNHTAKPSLETDGPFTEADYKDTPILNIMGKGAMMNLLSPGPYLFWALVSGPILLSGWQQSAANGSTFLISFYGTLIVCTLGILLLFHQTRRLGPRVVRILVLVSIIVLLVFGLVLLGQGIQIW
jgi:threonine/homoserine/homoserine lactone efflux protein